LSSLPHLLLVLHFSFTYPSPSHIYPLSLHDALPISQIPISASRPAVAPAHPPPPVLSGFCPPAPRQSRGSAPGRGQHPLNTGGRSEEHTSELQSHLNLVCRLLLEKKKNILIQQINAT